MKTLNEKNYPETVVYSEFLYRRLKQFNTLKFTLLGRDNRKAFREILKRPKDFIFNGEVKFDVWKVEFKGAHFFIFSGPGIGTSCEYIGERKALEDKNIQGLVLDFANDMYEKLAAYYRIRDKKRMELLDKELSRKGK